MHTGVKDAAYELYIDGTYKTTGSPATDKDFKEIGIIHIGVLATDTNQKTIVGKGYQYIYSNSMLYEACLILWIGGSPG